MTWQELIGLDTLATPPLGRCNRCHRKTWAANEIGTEDRVTQPDGNPCGGKIVATMSGSRWALLGQRTKNVDDYRVDDPQPQEEVLFR